jgi:DNA-binding transcriptional ArsR family regulator
MLGITGMNRPGRPGVDNPGRLTVLLYNVMVNSSGDLDSVFSALADPTRRRIVERLARGPLTVGEIASGFSISQPAISRHVRVLEESGLLEREVLGRVHRCTLSPDVMQAASGWIDKQRAFWNAVLDRLDDLLEEPPKRKKKQ